MSRKQIAQIFPTGTFLPTKVSLHLRPAGTPSQSFLLTSAGTTVIDAVNFSTLDQGAIYSLVEDTDTQFTGAGYISSHSASSSTVAIVDSTVAQYPIRGIDDGAYNVFIRLKSVSSYQLEILLDNIPYKAISGSATEWTWVASSLVVFDESVHNLGLAIRNKDVLIDKIVIKKSPTLPTGYGPDYTLSPYVTVIARLAEVSGGIPTTYFDAIDYTTTLNDIHSEGWYSFNTNSLKTDATIASQTQLALAILASGSSSTHYVVWDTAEKTTNPTAIQTDLDGWVANALQSMSIQVYSSHAAVDGDCKLTTPEAVLTNFHQGDFAPASIKPKLNNTIYVDDGFNGSDVSLDVGDKLIGLNIDQTGSMTWNDNTKLRFDFANQIIDTLDIKYPGNVRYNLTQFSGEPCFSFLVPLTEKVSTNEVKDIIKAHFKDDSDHFAGFRVIRKKDGYSTSPIDGEIVFDGYALAALDIELEENTLYYYTVYTYDQHLTDEISAHWSNGVRLSVSTHELVVPRGLPNFAGKVLNGYDLKLDSNTINLWQTDEGQGDFSYDFSPSSASLTLNNTRWLGFTDCPTGISGLRFDGFSSYAESLIETSYTGDLSIYMWVYPFENRAGMGLMSVDGSSNSGFSLLLDNGILKLALDRTNQTNTYNCGTPIANDAWTHVAVTVHNGIVKFYLNGVLKSTTGSVSVLPSAWTAGKINIGRNLGNSTSEFFGKISHISLHSVARTASEVFTASVPVVGSDANGNPQPVDNGDRLVVIDYVIPEDLNYQTIRIVRNAIQAPAHENDGTIILETSAIPGKYSFSAGYPYDVAEPYWFRVFTRNSLGNWCDIRDAHLIKMDIPNLVYAQLVDDLTGAKSTEGPGIGNTGAVTVQISRTGNEKVYFKWTPPSDSTTRVKVYYSADSFPYYDSKSKTIEGGTVVFDKPVGVNEFVHRKLPNRQMGYYAIVTFDRLGKFGDPATWATRSHFPLNQLDDTGIPLLEAQNVGYSLVDYDMIRIIWDSPVEIKSSLSGYYDDRFYVYGAICDLYGTPIPIAFPDGVNITTTLTPIDISKIEDAFQLGLNTQDSEKIPLADWRVNPEGLITGLVRLRPSPLFAVIQKLDLSVSIEYTYSNSFKYIFPSGSFTFQNPLDFKITNRDNLYFDTREYAPADGCVTSEESGADITAPLNSSARKRVNGTYIRRKLPFAIRAFYTYKGLPINSTRISARIFDAVGGPCSMTPASITQQSSTVTLQSNTFQNVSETVPIVDGNGIPTGYTETVSYADIFVIAPFLPQSASVFVKLDALAYIALKKMNIFFPTILKLEINPHAPESNNIDVREQFARSYLIDPDHPTDETLYTFPPENTVAKWVISKGNVPFYSIDNVPLANGVYSYFRSGTARNVFLGPATPTVAGIYNITVSTTVRGLFATASGEVEIKGRSGSNFENFIPDPAQPRILCEFPQIINYLWADGIDYEKMIITRNPVDHTKSTTKYANKFRECSTALFPLPPGTTVTVEAKGYEILHGDVLEYTDSSGVLRINASNALRAVDAAQVTLTRDPYTYVYFRRNEFIKSAGCQDVITTSCAAFDVAKKICFDPYDIGVETAVVVSTKINFNGKPLTIYGGGGLGNDGRPPCIEPLYVRYLGLFNSVDLPVSDFKVDNRTVQHMYFEIRFAGEPIPTGTPIPVFACDLVPQPPLAAGEVCRRINSSVGVPLIVYVKRTNQLPGQTADPYQEYSIIDIPVGPLDPAKDISLGVYPIIEYKGNQPVVAEN
jgi:hypothetical protein